METFKILKSLKSLKTLVTPLFSAMSGLLIWYVIGGIGIVGMGSGVGCGPGSFMLGAAIAGVVVTSIWKSRKES